MPCRINSRRIWTTRMLLELHQHRAACFVTLTYSDENLPSGNTLVKRDVQLWLKKLRFACEPIKLRYFVVGEYGDRTGRAHYHAILFGIDGNQQEVIDKSWGLGHVYIGSAENNSIQYVAGYVTKKMTKKDDIRLNGRAPEFALMSRNPGIGARAAEQIGEQLTRSSGGALWVAREGDAPKVVRTDGKMMPLGRYMVGKVRLAVGMDTINSPPAKKAQYDAQMLALRESYGPALYAAAKPFVEWSKAQATLNREKHPAKVRRIF